MTDAEWRRLETQLGPMRSRGAPPSFTSVQFRPLFGFFPQAGTPDEELVATYFNDLDPTRGLLDYDCSAITYDGHDATDMALRTFDEQDIGVPVFAAADGVVLATDDGHFDKVTQPTGTELANYVVIDHGDGRVCYYWHLRNGSVAVAPGSVVQRGQQIGMTASSGNSTGPHLHFATYDQGARIEPFTSGCNPGTSQWLDQLPLQRSPYLLEFAFSHVDLSPYFPPFAMPRTGSIGKSDALVWFWLFLPNLPANGTWQTKFRNPSGTVKFDSGVGVFNNPTPYRWSWWWWSWLTGANGMLDTVGTWTMEVWIDGTLLKTVPIEVQTTWSSAFNRAPEPIALTVDPPTPTAQEASRVSVVGDPILDDRDYQVVRYRYQWQVNATIVRDVVTAARSDLLPPQQPGDVITCSVTPNDGVIDGTAAQVAFSIADDEMPLGAHPLAPSATDQVSLWGELGLPGAICLMAVTKIDSVPTFVDVVWETFDNDGSFEWATVVPTDALGHDVDVVLFGIGQDGKVKISPPRTLAFQ
jgi:hypothetical protein